MTENPLLDLYDRRHADVALKVETFARSDVHSEPLRSNYFTVHWIQKGRGTVWADSGEYTFGRNLLLFLVPYQCFRIAYDGLIRGLNVKFH
jgi:hypothetical protein